MPQDTAQAATTIGDKAGFDQLVSDLAAAAASYYESDVLLMSDAEYDTGIDQVTAALAEHPDWSTDASDGLLDEVAAGQSAGGEVTHPTRMLSMDKTAGDAAVVDVPAFVTRVAGPIVVEPKMDGLAARAEYRNGRLVLVALRGDGTTGDDVTSQVTRGTGIAGLPAVMATAWTGQVRGEVFMTLDDFDLAQQLRTERGGKEFANPRNATAGSLRKEGEENWMPMSFAVYDLDGDYPLPSRHVDRMQIAAKLGFTPAADLLARAGLSSGPYETSDDVVGLIAALEAARPGLPFEIDGAVIKADQSSDRTRLGEGSRTPKWALAYKYPPMQATSYLRDIEVGIGRTGRISLRAVIDPTKIAGSTVERATLHHPGFVVEQGLGIGSKVLLEKRGDVIPRVQAPLDTAENAAIPAWVAPQTCPQCDEPWDKTSLLWRCHTPSCSVAGRLTYFLSGDCLDVDGFGPAIAEALADAELAKDPADLFDLTFTQWATLQTGITKTGTPRVVGEKNAKKIMDGLEKAKSQPFNRVITSLGIRMTGRTVGRWLAAAYPTMDALRAATVADVASLEGLGDIKATHIVDGLAKLVDVVDRLAAHGVNMGSEPVDDGTPKPLVGMTVVVSGSVPGYTKTTAAEAITAAGGKASGSVSKNTTFLVTAETSTAKAVKAAQLGVPIVDPDDFGRLLAGQIRPAG